MLAKTITYHDFDDVVRTETFYFNLKRDELIELNVRYPKGLQKHIEVMQNSSDNLAIYQAMKEVIMMAYGERSEDGRAFIKSREKSEWFTQTNAFDELIVELFTKEGAAAAFINAIIPQESKT